MSETQVHGLPSGVYILWCDGVPVPIHKDPRTMTASEVAAACSGSISTFKVSNLELRLRDDGHYEAIPGSAHDLLKIVRQQCLPAITALGCESERGFRTGNANDFRPGLVKRASGRFWNPLILFTFWLTVRF